MLRLTLAASLTVAIVGCEVTVPGEPRLLVENVATTELDFGTVPMTKRVTRAITLSNVGRSNLRLEGFSRQGMGPAVQLGTAVVEPDPVFGIDFEPVDVPAGESRELTFFFHPPQDPTQVTVPHEVKLKLTIPNADPMAPPTILTLKGLALTGGCDLSFPPRIDFGAVARGDTFSVVEMIKNRRPIESFPRVGDITSSDTVFSLSSDSPRGEFSLAPGRDKNVSFQFAPTESRDYFANLWVLPADGCPEVNVRLIGTGVDSVLSWTQTILDFGNVQPTVTVTGEVTFNNQSFAAIELSGLTTREGANPSSIFSVTAANMGDLTRLTVPPATRDATTNAIVPGTARVTVSFRPELLGVRQGTLAGTTTARNQPSLNVPLRGIGRSP